MNKVAKPVTLAHALQQVSRVAGLLSLAFLFVVVFGEGGIRFESNSRHETLLAVCLGAGCAGIVLGFFLRGPGAATALGSLAAFYALHRHAAGEFPRGPWFLLLLGVPGLLFLASLAAERLPGSAARGAHP